MLFLATMIPSWKLVLFVIGICCLLPILILSIIVMIKLAHKHRINMRKLKQIEKENKPKKGKNNKVTYLNYFGGEANILEVSKNLSRVTVKVNDIKLVDLQALKNEGIGIMITGNVIKCSSQAFADQIED